MKLILAVLLIAALGTAAYIRLAPSDPARWNIDPVAASDPGDTGVLLEPGKVVFEDMPETLLTRLDGVMRAQPRTTVLTGSTADLQITYIVRSKWLGFPDYITVKALTSDGGGSTLAILSRSRFGGSDIDVNEKRLDRILSDLRQISD